MFALKNIHRIIAKKIFKKTLHFDNFLNTYSTSMDKPKVYITRSMNREIVDILSECCDVISWPGTESAPQDEIMKQIKDVDGLFCFLTDKIDKKLLFEAKKLRVISTMSVGYDHLDLEEIKKRNIKIGYTPDILTDSTAELAVGLLLATTRRLIEANNAAKDGEWLTWSPFWMCGNTLKNSTVGFFGFGRIGQEIAKRLKPFKVKKFIYNTRRMKPEAEEIGAEMVEFDTLLNESDIILVCCSFNEETKEKFDINTFKKMKKNAVFINTSRGGVVKQADLLIALQEKIIWGAGLDVTTPEPLPIDNPLFQLKNCVILPHIGSATTECREEMAALTARNIVAALKDETMPSELK